MATLLWSVRISEDLRKLVLPEELLKSYSYKPAVIIVSDLYLDFLSK